MIIAVSRCHAPGITVPARWSTATALLVGLGTCVGAAPEDTLPCTQDGSCAAGDLLESPSDAPVQSSGHPTPAAETASAVGTVSVPIRPSEPSFAPPPMLGDDAALLPDPWSPEPAQFGLLDVALLDPDALSDVLSLLLDDLILGSVPPADPPNDLPFLERLCRETELPDFRCRQLYGE